MYNLLGYIILNLVFILREMRVDEWYDFDLDCKNNIVLCGELIRGVKVKVRRLGNMFLK